MNRREGGTMNDLQGVPHSRGDEPHKFSRAGLNAARSPQPWG